MTLAITPIYAGILTLLLIALSARVIMTRRKGGISVGDHGDKAMIKAMRVQANCAEYAPIGIIMLLLLELQTAPAWQVHALGSMLVLGRLCHAYGFGSTPQIIPLRQNGMILTFSMLALTAILNVVYAIF